MSDKKIKVVVVQRVLAVYREFLYEELGKEYNLHVIHGRSMDYVPVKYLTTSARLRRKYYGKRIVLLVGMVRKILSIRPDVIIHEMALSMPQLPVVIAMSRIMGIKIILWGHGYEIQKGWFDRGKIKDAFRLTYCALSSGMITYTDTAARLYKRHFKSKIIEPAWNTVSVTRSISPSHRLNQEGYVLMYLGRLVPGKGPIDFLEICSKVLENTDCDIIMIGDGPLREDCIKHARLLGIQHRLMMVGARYGDELYRILERGRIINVNPGYVGLSVVELMHYSIPTVYFVKNKYEPPHSPEVDYLKTGVNSIMSSGDSCDCLIPKIESITRDEKLYESLMIGCNETVKGENAVSSADRMIKSITSTVNRVYRG